MPVIGFGSAFAMGKRSVGLRTDPYGAYNFHVELESLIVGGFSEVSGLSITTEVEKKKQGGINDREYVYLKNTTYSDIVLQRGIIDLDGLYGWYEKVVKGNDIKKKNGTIYLLDHAGSPITWWNFEGAIPVKWEGPSFQASSTTIATERFTLAIEKLERTSGAQIASGLRSVTGGLFDLF